MAAPERLPGSCPARKMLGSCHSVLTISKKLGKLKNQQPFLDPWGSEVTGQTSAPKSERATGRCTESQLTWTVTSKEPVPDGTTWTELMNCRGSVWTALSIRKSRGPTLLGVFPPGAPPGSHSEYWKKIPWCFCQGEGKRTILRYSRGLCF